MKIIVRSLTKYWQKRANCSKRSFVTISLSLLILLPRHEGGVNVCICLGLRLSSSSQTNIKKTEVNFHFGLMFFGKERITLNYEIVINGHCEPERSNLRLDPEMNSG